MSSVMKKKPSRKWLLYILKCRDGTFYTGITCDLERRLEQHGCGRASRYTRSRLPVSLIHAEGCRSKSSALKKEFAMKSLSRMDKEEYIKGKKGRAQRSR